jgi:hypothetical protein
MIDERILIMFRQLVTPHPGAPLTQDVINNINSLFTYHPLQISAIVETVWLNRYNAAPSQISSPFVPWPPEITYPILNAPFFSGYTWPGPSPLPAVPPPAPLQFAIKPPIQQPGLGWSGNPVVLPLNPANPATRPTHHTNWDHLIYAYVIENTRIYEIFRKVLHKYIHGGELETPSPASQLFWRNLEFLIHGDAVPSMVWTTSGRLRRDEQAERCSTYFWMFGIDLSHAAQLAAEHPYEKPAASNRDFIPTFEAFGREVWRGIVNSRNISGANDTDPNVIAVLAERIYDMMQTQRQSGNQSREEFRAVAIMSYLHLAVLYDSPAVIDLRAEASSPEMRLQKIAERIGMTAHPKSKALFDLAGPFSFLMQSIETGKYNDASVAPLLYSQVPQPTFVSRNAEDVIDQYTLATGRDLKSLPVSVVQRAATASLPVPKRQTPPAQLTGGRANGHAAPKQ